MANDVCRYVTTRCGMLNSLLLASFCRLFRRGQVRGDLAAHCGQAAEVLLQREYSGKQARASANHGIGLNSSQYEQVGDVRSSNGRAAVRKAVKLPPLSEWFDETRSVMVVLHAPGFALRESGEGDSSHFGVSFPTPRNYFLNVLC